MPRDLIVFGEDWGGLPSSTQHLMRHLAQGRKLLWVNSIGLRRPKPQWRDLQRAWRKARAAGRKPVGAVTTPNPRFRVLDPLTLPAPRSRLERGLAARLLAAQIRPLMKREGIKDPILWSSLPTAVDMAGNLGESALVYYCGDDFSALAGVDHDTVSRREQELVRRADLVLAASPALARKLSGGNTRLLPHGVDFELFSSPATRAADLPADGRPTAGFYGSLSEWLDLELLTGVIARLPHWHFVFIGKAAIDTRPLRRFGNVHLLGERPHGRLPGYSQHWNASLLPFRDSAQIRACNPLKLREYLAAGRPVVGSDFPALAEYRHLVHRVDGVDAMVETLEWIAVAGSNPAQAAAVADHDWSTRARQVSRWLEAL